MSTLSNKFLDNHQQPGYTGYTGAYSGSLNGTDMGQGFRDFLRTSKPLIKGVNGRVRLHSLSPSFNDLLVSCYC